MWENLFLMLLKRWPTFGRNSTANHSKQFCENRHLQRGRVWLFYQALPKKTLHLKDDKCTGSKHSQIRVTGLAAAKTASICHWQIGKWWIPKCFKNAKNLSCRYQDQNKAGWIQRFLKIGLDILSINLKKKTGKLHSSLITVHPIQILED